jgi:hypothetical protein
MARRVGLAYWPALLGQWKIDPRVFARVERWLENQGFEPWDGRGSHGGWDSEGTRGISPADVERSFFAAGCKTGPKFWAQLRLRQAFQKIKGSPFSWSDLFARKGESAAQFRAFARGAVWIGKNRHFIGCDLSRKAVIAIGRLSANVRWAAIYGVAGANVRIRDLNWSAVAEAQKGLHAALRFMPPAVQKAVLWHKHMPTVATAGMQKAAWHMLPVNPASMPLAVLRRTLDAVGYEPADILPVVNLVRLFGRDEAAMRRFVGGRTLHDAGQFTLPLQELAPGWGALVLQAPTILRWSASFAEAEDLLGGRVPRSPAEFRTLVESGALGISGWAEEAHLSSDEVSDYDTFFQENPHKGFEMVPAPQGCAAGEYRLEQLQANDPLQVLAGRLVDCCQHLHGAGASCARQAWTEPAAAIWAVYKGRTMVGQSFVWRSRDDRLVLDSVECLIGHERGVAEVTLLAAQSVLGRLGVVAVDVSTTSYGATEMVAYSAEDRRSRSAPEAVFRLGYTDAHSVKALCVVPGEAVIGTARSASYEAAEQAHAAVNEITPGSGVFCEHCDAEVHPDCEICPSCGADISEWVEDEEEEEA